MSFDLNIVNAEPYQCGQRHEQQKEYYRTDRFEIVIVRRERIFVHDNCVLFGEMRQKLTYQKKHVFLIH